MAPIEESDVIKKRKSLEIPIQPDPDAFAALTPRETSVTKKGRTRSDGTDEVPEPEFTKSEHIPLTTHTDAFGNDPVPISWGHPDPAV
eukprot:CAMPEP_0170332328 /NCGR_PEP_ID=MMETSP0116_2-20130129/67161_1 /TAXON_ID=400756 /ORGANISM="Durinskia baltica, Strain CSIRO CS-38" /LENGTH=87 /DNA_ID=CAMNT_0010585625 /DNA_START=54 /DNA_END=313 /DNA_ORIENTATION=+